MGILAALARAVAWNAALGAITGLGTGLVIVVSMAGEEDVAGAAVIVPLIALGVGLWYGVMAGVVHAVAQLPVLIARPARIRVAIRVVATLVSVVLVLSRVVSTSDDDVMVFWIGVAVFAPYLALTPILAVWGYADANTAAAESAARRNGASTESRISGSASDSSRAASE